MEQLLSEAKEKGLVLVNSEDSNETKLLSDYEKVSIEVEALLEIQDPENKPFESKYKARELLDQFLKQLEATKAIASLEKKSDSFLSLLRRLIAAAQVKVGSISWDCEEPHNAQTELEQAAAYYFPNVVKEIDELVGDRDEKLSSVSPEFSQEREDTLKEIENLSSLPSSIHLPTSFFKNTVCDAMKCLNILGILWAGRGQPLKSLYYLLAASQCYHIAISASSASSSTAPGSSSTSSAVVNPPSSFFDLSANLERKELENSFTHNLFYLAQAYGNLKIIKKSSKYCQMTLQRQLSTTQLTDIKTALEWIKNCCGISDFYLSAISPPSPRLSSLALLSAEKILKEKVISSLYSEMEKQLKEVEEREGKEKSEEMKKATNQKPNFIVGNLNAAEIEADIHRRFVFLDSYLLKVASERFKELQYLEEIVSEDHDNGKRKASLMEEMNKSYENNEETVEYNRLLSNSLSNEGKEEGELFVSFFEGLPIKPLSFMSVIDINGFDDARIVFLRASSRLEQSKKYYVLDGFVTDHVTLLQENSKLYHSLSSFEKDFKRKTAMEARRIDLLDPIIKALNKISYEVLHKQVATASFSLLFSSLLCTFFQISYELGETALGLLDLKLDKLRNESSDGVIDIKTMKKADIIKCNGYAKQSLGYLSHFTFLYAQSKDRKEENAIGHFETLPLYDLVNAFCSQPDECKLSYLFVVSLADLLFLCRYSIDFRRRSSSLFNGKLSFCSCYVQDYSSSYFDATSFLIVFCPS
jgi:hypothetical protein